MPGMSELRLTYQGDVPVSALTGVDREAVQAERFGFGPEPYEYALESDRHYLAIHNLVVEESDILVDGVVQRRS